MATVKLPSGKIARVPDGLTEDQVRQLLLDKLPQDSLDYNALSHTKDKEDYGVENTGFTGVGLAAIGGLVGSLFGGFVGGTAGAGLGSLLGNTVETVIGDWVNERDASISKQEFEDILSRAGIDVAVGGGGAIVFSVGRRVISGTLGKLLSYAHKATEGAKPSKGVIKTLTGIARTPTLLAGRAYGQQAYSELPSDYGKDPLEELPQAEPEQPTYQDQSLFGGFNKGGYFNDGSFVERVLGFKNANKSPKKTGAFDDYYARRDARAANPPISIRNVAELTPIIGDALAAEEIYRELHNDPINWTLIGILGGATLIGVVPGIGDAAAAAIKAGARKGAELGVDAAGAARAVAAGDTEFLKSFKEVPEGASVGARVAKPLQETYDGIAILHKGEEIGHLTNTEVQQLTGKTKDAIIRRIQRAKQDGKNFVDLHDDARFTEEAADKYQRLHDRSVEDATIKSILSSGKLTPQYRETLVDKHLRDEMAIPDGVPTRVIIRSYEAAHKRVQKILDANPGKTTQELVQARTINYDDMRGYDWVKRGKERDYKEANKLADKDYKDLERRAKYNEAELRKRTYANPDRFRDPRSKKRNKEHRLQQSALREDYLQKMEAKRNTPEALARREKMKELSDARREFEESVGFRPDPEELDPKRIRDRIKKEKYERSPEGKAQTAAEQATRKEERFQEWWVEEAADLDEELARSIYNQ